MYLKIQGLVLRRTEYNDHDVLLTILSKEHGKITAKARGLKRKNSPLTAQCQLLAFAELHKAIFRDEAAGAAFAGSFSRYHAMLRSQLAFPLRKFCQSDFAAEFIAENLLTWTMAGTDFAVLYGMIEKLF